MCFFLWNIYPYYAEYTRAHVVCRVSQLMSLCLASLSANLQLNGNCQSESIMMMNFSLGTVWHEEKGSSQRTWFTGQKIATSKKQWSEREMKFKNLVNWGSKKHIGIKAPKWSSLHDYLIKKQFPNFFHCPGTCKENGISTIDFIQYISLSSLYLLSERLL